MYHVWTIGQVTACDVDQIFMSLKPYVCVVDHAHREHDTAITTAKRQVHPFLHCFLLYFSCLQYTNVMRNIPGTLQFHSKHVHVRMLPSMLTSRVKAKNGCILHRAFSG